jgi:hypothetical protein
MEEKRNTADVSSTYDEYGNVANAAPPSQSFDSLAISSGLAQDWS